MLRARRADLSILAAYVAASFGSVGWELIPHPGRLFVGGTVSKDPQLFIWTFAWWPHAIANFLNPFSTHVIYAPTGINLTWTAGQPGLAIAFAPLTALFGPVLAYNVAAVLMPAFSAWTAYLLCRHLTGSVWASLVGGCLYGFSTTLILQELIGDLNVTTAFVLPLIALVVVRSVQGELSGRQTSWRLGVLLALQVWITEEYALTTTLALALAMTLAFWLIPELRARLGSSVAPIIRGYLLGGLLASPFLLYVLLGLPSGPSGWNGVQSDLLNLAVPPWIAAIGGSTFHSLTNRFAGIGGYLGLPTLLIVGAVALRAKRSHLARFLSVLFLACATIPLGATLYVGGKKLFPLPWRLVTHVPVLNDVIPFRFAAFVSLVAAVIVALWTAQSKGRVYPRPFVLPALAVAALFPAVWDPAFRAQAAGAPQRPSFFGQGLYRSCIPRNETLMLFPFGSGGDSLLYQAESDFWFRMAEDHLQPLPAKGHKAWASFDDDWVVRVLNESIVARPTMDSLLAFAAIHHVDRFISISGNSYPTAAQMRRFGPVQRVGGILVSPACGQPSLVKRDLTSFTKTYIQQRQSHASVDYCLGASLYTLEQGLEPFGPLQGARPALFVTGQGLTCTRPPSGYKHHGFATPDMSVPADTYPLYTP